LFFSGFLNYTEKTEPLSTQRFSALRFQKELEIPLIYKTRRIDRFLRLDYLVENQVVLELKSLEKVLPLHEAQLLTYLKLTGKQVGLLINFNVPLLKNGIYRRILGVNIASSQELQNSEKIETREYARE
jgi:GxxExxY protein